MSSNTGDNRKPGSFSKGDARINRRGRPKSFDQVRALAMELVNEIATDANGNPIIINGHKATNAEMILRSWMKSKDARLQQAFAAYAWGKPPEKTEITGLDGGSLIIEVKEHD